MGPHRLPSPLQRRIEAMAGALMSADGIAVDFTAPAGAPALVAADSVSWRLFKNPVSLFIGGVAAVLLELAEPKVRAGVWDHTSFKTDPVTRLRRTGLAAMVTVYAPREVAEAMIAGVNRRHAKVTGVTEDGSAYAADDPDLLDWVQATASWGFITAYDRFVEPLPPSARDRAWAEAAPAARLYGALNAPASQAAWEATLAAMDARLGPSPVIFEFLDIIRKAPALPAAARLSQPLLVKAAVDLVPAPLRARLGLEAAGLSRLERPLVKAMGRAADRLVLESAPPAQASVRMGLPADWLYRPPTRASAA
ncbi:oxygenase MpaB family protein [Brevundimonas sp. Root1279]|uniref:oxygenase MpaB family protein n=1 Tax=Brevundimonas sp. Root1279 TaxID=1736443 RepID=UPI0012E3A9AA|nr:oxygenase MpaB family protein [Brevundimonas sp. Root1279]